MQTDVTITDHMAPRQQPDHDDGDSPRAPPPAGGPRHPSTHPSADAGAARGGARAAAGGPPRAAFLRAFCRTAGAPQIVALCLVLALALGATVGVVPAVVGDRYARRGHGHTGAPCAALAATDDMPRACLLGDEDAQNAAAATSFVSNALTFATSPLMGSISDERGRRGLLLLGIGLSVLPPLCLVLLQLHEGMDPAVYYASSALTGVVSWSAVALASLSDVMPPLWRAPAFGLVLAGLSLGLALAPTLAVFLGHLGASLFALSVATAGFAFACAALPETRSPGAAARTRAKRLAARPPRAGRAAAFRRAALRPVRELLILNRNALFRLLAAVAFFSGIVGTADQTLLIYYVRENIGFDDEDVATLFLTIGAMSILVQTALLKPLNSAIGERRVVMVAFLVGALHNCLYGVAAAKSTIFVAAALASLTMMAFPTIAAIKSNNVDESEQGQIQGALYSLSSLASALGPMSLRCVSRLTKDGGRFGRGTMFIFGACLYLVATMFAWLLPEERANSNLAREAKKYNRLVDVDSESVDYGAIEAGGS